MDITERKRAEEALKKSEQRFRTLIEKMPLPLSVLREGRITYVNDEYLRSLGYASRSEVIGRMGIEIIAPQFRPQALEWERRRAQGKATANFFETAVLRKDGSQLPMMVAVTEVELEEGMVVITLGFDITDRKRAEMALLEYRDHLEEMVERRTAELTQSKQELESFAYSVSHDLRAPLRGIEGFSHALLEDHAAQLDEEGRDYLNRVSAATQRMAQLIDDLLGLSRVIRAPMKQERVDLSGLTGEIADELRERDPERRVEFTIERTPPAYGDPHLLRAVLENLLDNAWKFTGRRPQGKIAFGAELKGGETVYYVRDNGAGFDMAYAGKLFGAFQRLHSTREFPGTGIGLATVQRIIRRHGGRIWAESAPGKGAAFFFTVHAGRENDQR